MTLDLAAMGSDASDGACLLGTVEEAQGKLEAAQAAFAEHLAIGRRLAEQDPSSATWQRESQWRIAG